jgi:hypothetical protein
MALADQTYITQAIGDPGSTNITSAEITEAADYGDSEVFGRTSRASWAPGDQDYTRAKMAANLFAISMLKRKFPDLAGTSNSDYRTAADICQQIVSGDTDETSADPGEVLGVSGSYGTYPANPDAPYAFATRSRGGAATFKDINNGFR